MNCSTDGISNNTISDTNEETSSSHSALSSEYNEDTDPATHESSNEETPDANDSVSNSGDDSSFDAAQDDKDDTSSEDDTNSNNDASSDSSENDSSTPGSLDQPSSQSSEDEPSSSDTDETKIEITPNSGTMHDPDLTYFKYTPTGDETVINRTEYLNRLHGFWLAQCLANWTGIQTEGDRKEAPFYTDADWGGDLDYVIFTEGNPWWSDDDTDIEYVYQHLLDVNNTSMLTGLQIRDGWVEHIGGENIWASNAVAYDLMVGGMIPPATSDPDNNSAWELIDAQLTTEIFGTYAPGRPDIATKMSLLPIQTVARLNAQWAAEFYVIMHSLAFTVDQSLSQKEKIFWLAAQARTLIPDDSYIADMYDFGKLQYESNPTDWASARDAFYYRYQDGYAANYNYGSFVDAGINFAASMVSLFYGEGDLPKTIRIGTLAGWDSDNPTATWGGLIGLMIGKEGVEDAFNIYNFSDQYTISGTRINFPDRTPDLYGEDTFPLMAERGVYIIDRVVQEEMGGGVDLDKDVWYIPTK